MNHAGLHGGGAGGQRQGGPGGNRPGGFGGSGYGPAGGHPAFTSSADSMHYGSEQKSRTGAGLGSGDFDSSTSNAFNSDATNLFGTGSADTYTGSTENAFNGTPGNNFRGGQVSGFNPGSLSQLSGDVGRGLASQGHTNAAVALGALPAASQFLRGGLNLPVNSSFGNFRLSYQSPFSLNNNFQFKDANGFGSPAAAYESPHVRSGHVDFSASAKVGVRSEAGMGSEQNGLGSHGSGHPGNSSDPSSSLSFKLSF
jgi:hypothetical protein